MAHAQQQILDAIEALLKAGGTVAGSDNETGNGGSSSSSSTSSLESLLA